MHLIIVEDLEIDREKLMELLREDFARRAEDVDFSCYESGEEFLAHYRPRACDGLFLDILLGGMNGIEIARKVRETEKHLPVIFTTRERDYAVDGFDIGARDYLVKPLTAEKVSRCMERMREYLARPSSIPLRETSGWGHAAPLDIPLDDILYAQYGNHIVDVHTTRGVFCARQSFQDFTAQLPHSGRFCVCGRGLIINLSQVAQVWDDVLLLKNGETLSIPLRRKKEIQRAYTEWKFTCTRKGGLGMKICWSAVANLLIQSCPAHLLAYWPFRDRLRFPLWKALLPVCLVLTGELLLYGYIVQAGGDGMKLAYGFAPVYMGMYFFTVRDDRWKILFLYLFVLDYTMILWGAAAFLEARFFYAPGGGFNSWRSVLFSLAVLAVTAPFMLHFLTRAKEKVFATDAPGFWRTAWLIPAFTTAIVQIFTGDLSMREVRSFRFLFARVLLLLCALVFYSILLDALDGIRRQAALAEQAETQEQLLNLQRMQHEQLLQYNEEMNAVRHDLRQHLGVIQAYLDKDEIGGLKDYLKAYKRKLPPDIRRTFTKNFSLNAVCIRYAEEARKYEIDYDVELDLPEKLPINEPEVCALLGNLLENAVDSCRSVHTAPFIKVRGRWDDGQMVITVDNSCEQEPDWEGDRLRSSKHDGLGTGTWGVRRTAERSGGTAEFVFEDGVFYASVMLYG